MTPLPIDAVLSELVKCLRESGAVVLRAPTGAGKTTRVPPAVLPLTDKLVVVLEPRRVAARAAARRMADESDTRLGDRFGYHVRFDRVSTPRTRVLVVTPGVMLRMLLADPFLEAVGIVLFDEFHERGLEADLALGMVKLVRDSVRPDLRMVVMSATIETGAVAAYLGNCPVVASDGRSFPVEIRYRPRRSETPATDAAVSAVRELLPTTPGDVLVFLPGLREIRQAESSLGNLAGVEVLPLHGELPPDQQDRALRKLDRRKIVLATNVAETSVTVDGVTAVIDTGLARHLEFDPGVGMDRLRLGPISKASADQRSGRAGRTQPGVCVRLWDEIGHRARPDQTTPEVRRVDLAPAVLHLLALGEADPTTFAWFDPPRPEALTAAAELLDRLGATKNRTITDLGRTLADLPVHPRLGRMLVEAQRLGVVSRAAVAAAILSDRDPFVRENAPPTPTTVSDILDRVEAVEGFARNGRLDFPQGRLHPGGVRGVLQARDQLVRVMRESSPPTFGGGLSPDDALLRAVFAAYPDRLARRRERGDRRGLMVGGRGVTLAPSSGVRDAELFVCVDVDAGGVESFVRLASGVERDWLPANQLVTRHEVEFDPDAEKLIARKRTRFADLILTDVPGHIGDETAAAVVLTEAAARNLPRVKPDPESAAGRLLTRLACLRIWLPDSDLPSFDDAALADILPELCRGRRSFADLRSGPWADAIRGRLSYAQLQRLDRGVPDTFRVPSGSEIALAYEVARPPVLAAKIQELFGLLETPRVAGGRVKVLLHLLAPNGRPQQVTDDLASFWKSGYPQVRKDLRNRYPKHDWPEDPLTATASRGVKRRS